MKDTRLVGYLSSNFIHFFFLDTLLTYLQPEAELRIYIYSYKSYNIIKKNLKYFKKKKHIIHSV